MRNFITPKELRTQLPLRRPERINSYRKTVTEILEGKDPRTLLIVGPCSIHDIDSAYDYAKRLKSLANEVEEHFFICMRTYFEKARTALGWKGMMYDPALDGSHNMQDGYRLARTLLIALSELGLAAATEFLEPYSSSYIGDLISWGSIGARTCQSPIHRQLASNLDMPIGFKNRSDGSVDIAINACLSAKEPHHFLAINDEGRLAQVRSSGNPLPHLVLRGSEQGPNFDFISIQEASERLKEASLLDAVIVDCSHDNAEGDFQKQTTVFWAAANKRPVRGIMLESFLEAGAQDEPIKKSLAQSITDPCLDWQTTKALIQEAAKQKVSSCIS